MASDSGLPSDLTGLCPEVYPGDKLTLMKEPYHKTFPDIEQAIDFTDSIEEETFVEYGTVLLNPMVDSLPGERIENDTPNS